MLILISQSSILVNKKSTGSFVIKNHITKLVEKTFLFIMPLIIETFLKMFIQARYNSNSFQNAINAMKIY